MNSRSLRIVGLWTALMFVTVFSAMVQPTTLAQETNTTLERLATATNRAASQLSLTDEASEILVDGTQLVRVKAVDTTTNEIVGASFIGDTAVDAQAARAAASQQWRAAHGALTPDTVAAFAGLATDAPVQIAVWLNADITALPKADLMPSAVQPATAQAEQPVAAVGTGNHAKTPATPLDPSAIPASIQARLKDVNVAAPATEAVAKTPAEVAQHEANPAEATLSSAATQEQAAAFDQRNRATLVAQVAPLRTRFLQLAGERGLKVGYASETVPMAYLEGTRAQAEELARLPEINAVYFIHPVAGPLMAVARPTQNADLINNVGYNGAGITVAVVEGERIFAANPYLPVAAFYDVSQPYENHPTGVAGIIKSSHPTQHGLASGVTLYSGNGSYSNYGVMTAALDWGSAQATVLNNSYYWSNDGSSAALFELDRHMDYLVRYNYDFSAAAAGNFGGAPCATKPYVVTPAKGYNVMTVGNYNDFDTLGWSDDAMSGCSSYGDPGHAKPEVAAVGGGITSTIPSTDPNNAVGDIGSGTSYASPMVAALAADIMGANTSLIGYPEIVRSIIMATALHNIEGSSRLSDVDGVGAIDASAALATVERAHWAGQNISSATVFPLNYSVVAYKGERVRFVINWLSNPTSDYTTDPLPADLDLTAYRADGTTAFQSSFSIANNFEIVDFIAPASEIYQFRVTRFGGWSGGGTWLGAAWWRGTYRIAPDVGYTDPVATPLGTHLSVLPTDWSPTNYWRALGVRSTGSDHDVRLSTTSWFDDPGIRSTLAGSTYLTDDVDVIVTDGNHRNSTVAEHYRVNKFRGTGGYDVSWSNLGLILSTPGVYGPYSMTSAQVLKVFDVYFQPGQAKRLTIVPTTSNSDLALELFRSDPATASSWAQGRGSGVVRANAFGVGANNERLSYLYTGTTQADFLGLVVFNKVATNEQFYVVVENLATFVPLIQK